MSTRKIVLAVTIAAIGFGVAGLVGCEKKSQPAPADVNKAPAKVAAAAEVEQTMCPVMDGNKIDKNVFVEYKGKKVYFCCTKCKAVFEKDPEKYIAKLPQFAK
ncbi:MAG: YHS domain-containing protein [Sedimentisphaerales bacterium]|jgi:YHS domain-containing protein